MDKNSTSVVKKPPLLCGNIIPLFIDSLATGGSGVGRYEGFVVFTPFTCPGDEALVRIVLVKKSFAEAELVNLQKPSPERIQPPCSVFGQCGGCTWQHVSYSEQLKQKKLILESTFRKKPLLNEVAIRDVIPSPQEFEYRNRIQLKIDHNGRYGFYRRKSHDIIEIKNCPISDPLLFKDLEKKISSMHLVPSPLSSSDQASHREIEVYSSQKEQVKYKTIQSQSDSLEEGFSQVNQPINQILIQDVLKTLKKIPSSKKTIYDLYCGHGNFTFPIKNVLNPQKTLGIELNPTSIGIATDRVQKESLSHIHFINQDVKRFLKHCTSLEGPVLLDPPRVGCDKEILSSLRKLNPPVILYISCNPQTLARDLEILMGNKPLYRVQTLQPYDMFPQTDHVETLALLISEAI